MIELKLRDYILLTIAGVCFLFILATAGGVDQNQLPLSSGVLIIAINFVIMAVALKIVNLRQERRNNNDKR